MRDFLGLTGAAKAVALVIPERACRFDGYSLPVHTPSISVVDFVAQRSRPACAQELRAELTRAAGGALKGIMACRAEPLVSTDFKSEPHSANVDLEFTSARPRTWSY